MPVLQSVRSAVPAGFQVVHQPVACVKRGCATWLQPVGRVGKCGRAVGSASCPRAVHTFLRSRMSGLSIGEGSSRKPSVLKPLAMFQPGAVQSLRPFGRTPSWMPSGDFSP